MQRDTDQQDKRTEFT